MEIKKQNKILISALIILLLANVAIVTSIWINKPNATSTTQPNRMYTQQKFNRPFNHKNAFTQELNLTPQQNTQANEMRQEHFSKIKEIRNEIYLNKQKIHNELFNQNPDTSYIMNLADSIGQLNASLEKLNYEHFMVLKEILNPEQQAKLKQLMDDASFKKGMHKHRRGHNNNRKTTGIQNPPNN